MMKVTQGQIDDASRAALASGRAEPALALFIDSLMEMKGLSLAEGCTVAGGMLELETPVEMSADAFDRVMVLIEKGGPEKRAPEYSELIRLPAALADAISAAENRAGWTTSMGGVRKLKLDVGGDARAEIIRIDPGVAIPWHTHKGQELTLCLVGGYSDGRGSYGPGDVTLADPAVRHQPKADDDGPCFVLAVTDAGLKFEGVMGVIQKLTGG
ncbi:MAG TPA: cupin domain-containing protein [Hyphomonadaceae bacterium]|nr:cupin domain-containing protein [Hyphomonadaceae bacterium]